ELHVKARALRALHPADHGGDAASGDALHGLRRRLRADAGIVPGSLGFVLPQIPEQPVDVGRRRLAITRLVGLVAGAVAEDDNAPPAAGSHRRRAQRLRLDLESRGIDDLFCPPDALPDREREPGDAGDGHQTGQAERPARLSRPQQQDRGDGRYGNAQRIERPVRHLPGAMQRRQHPPHDEVRYEERSDDEHHVARREEGRDLVALPAQPFQTHPVLPRISFRAYLLSTRAAGAMIGRIPGEGSMPRHIVCLTFDHDHLSGFIARGQTTPTAISRGEEDVGVIPRLIALLERYGIKPPFFPPGHTIDSTPQAVTPYVEAGHELAHHGWTHRLPASLSRE